MADVDLAIEKEWDNVTEAEILEYIHSMQEYFAAVIAANGGHTRW